MSNNRRINDLKAQTYAWNVLSGVAGVEPRLLGDFRSVGLDCRDRRVDRDVPRRRRQRHGPASVLDPQIIGSLSLGQSLPDLYHRGSGRWFRRGADNPRPAALAGRIGVEQFDT